MLPEHLEVGGFINAYVRAGFIDPKSARQSWNAPTGICSLLLFIIKNNN